MYVFLKLFALLREDEGKIIFPRNIFFSMKLTSVINFYMCTLVFLLFDQVSLRGIVDKVLVCDIALNELDSRYYVHFRIIHLRKGLNSFS